MDGIKVTSVKKKQLKPGRRATATSRAPAANSEPPMAVMPILHTPPRVMTVRDVSDYLRVHTSTIYRLLKRGELPAFKVGSDWRFNIESIDQWRLSQSSRQDSEIKQ